MKLYSRIAVLISILAVFSLFVGCNIVDPDDNDKDKDKTDITMTDAEAVADAGTKLDYADITFASGEASDDVKGNFTLPLTGENGTVISWDETDDTGNNVSINDSTGVVTVTRPDFGDGDATVILTATITKGTETVVKYFTFIIVEAPVVFVENTGLPQWANTTIATTTSGYCWFKGVDVDSIGNIYAGGEINGTGSVNFGNSVSVSGVTNTRALVVVKYNSLGEAQWAKTLQSGPDDKQIIVDDVEVDSEDNVYISGYLPSGATYVFSGTVSLTPPTGNSGNFYLAKFDSNGNALWAKSAVSGWTTNTTTLASDDDGNIFISLAAQSTAYNFGDSVTYNSTSLNSNSIIIKYNSAGTPQWATGASSGAATFVFYGLDCDASGNVYAAGYINGTATVSFGTIDTTGVNASWNILLVKFNGSGVAQAGRTLTTATSLSYLKGVAVNRTTGDVYAVGSIRGAGAFDFGNSITAQVTNGGSSNNMLLLRLSSSLTTQSATVLADAKSKDNILTKVKVDSDGNVFASGYCTNADTFDFGNSVSATSPAAGDNPLLVMYSSTGVVQWAKFQTVRPGNSTYYDIGLFLDGSAYIAGYINSTDQYEFGNSITATGVISSNSNHLLVQFK